MYLYLLLAIVYVICVYMQHVYCESTADQYFNSCHTISATIYIHICTLSILLAKIVLFQVSIQITIMSTQRTTSGDSTMTNVRLFALPSSTLYNLTQNTLQFCCTGGLYLGVCEPHMDILECVWVAL